MLVITGTIVVSLFSKDKKTQKTDAEGIAEITPSQGISTPNDAKTTFASALITRVDLDSSSLFFMLLPDNPEDDDADTLELIYTGASDIRTKYNKPISATQLKAGDIVNISYTEDLRLVSLYGSDKVWRYKNIENLLIDEDLKKITLGDKVYRYNDTLKILCDDTFLTLDDLSKLDMLNLYGIDNYIYLIKVINGHGYLSLSNYSGFIGGTLSIGHGRTETITEDMKVLLEEGEYDVTAEKDGFSASAIIKISNSATSYFDLAGQGAAPVANGTVHFNIYPEESDLYIDGVKVFHSSPVTLSFGDHTVEAVLGGYNDYKGSINVNRSDISLSISLSPGTIPDSEEDVLYDEVTDNGNATIGNDTEVNPDEDNTADQTSSSTEDMIPDSTTDDSDYSNLPEVNGDAVENTLDDSATDDTDIDPSENTNDSSDNSEDNVSDTTEDTSSDSADNMESSGAPENTSDDTVESSDDNYSENISDTRDVTIYCSTGISVYADDEYVGETVNGSITFKYRPDTVTLRLEKAGYITKKYTVTIDADETESTFKFPDLTKAD